MSAFAVPPLQTSARKRVCVIGSGIAGLTAAYLLSSSPDFEVTLCEGANALGMDANSVDVPVPGGHARIDMPLRVFSNKYYPHLSALYEHVGIRSVPENYSGSFRSSTLAAPFFAYQNALLGAVSLPFVSWRHAFSYEFWSHVWQLARFHSAAAADLVSGRLAEQSLGEYLSCAGYSDAFIHKFFIPFVCAICTCTYAAALAYPADVMVDYLERRFLYGVRRAEGGTKEVVERLSARCAHVRLGCRIRSIVHSARGVVVTDDAGTALVYDEVVIAAQAHQVAAQMFCDFACFEFAHSHKCSLSQTPLPAGRQDAGRGHE
jgi:predicted NAD/FAD-binding protein